MESYGAFDNCVAVAIYKIVMPIVAYHSERKFGARLVTIPAGLLVDVSGEVELFGLLKVTVNDTTYEVFTRDIRERAEQLTRKPVARAGPVLCSRQTALN